MLFERILMEEAGAADGGAPAGGAGPSDPHTGADAIRAAADRVTSAFINGGGRAPGDGGEAGGDEPEVTFEDDAPAEPERKPRTAAAEPEKKPELKRRERPQLGEREAAEQRIKERLAKQRSAQFSNTPVDPTAHEAMRSELERLKSEGNTTRDRLRGFENAIKERDPEKFARLGGWESVEQFTKEFIAGKKPELPPDPEKEDLKRRLEAIESDKARELREREEARQREESERDFKERLSWILEAAGKHDVEAVKNVVKDPTIAENFAAQVHELMLKDNNIEPDEAYGTVLDGYRPIFKGLLDVFPEEVEAWIAERSKAQGASRPGGARTQKSDSGRRGAAVEGAKRTPATQLDAEGAATARAAEQFSPDKYREWGDKTQSAFISRLRSTG